MTNFEYNTRGWRTKAIGVDPDGTGPLDRGESLLTYDATGNVVQVGHLNIYGSGSTPDPVTFVYDYAGRKTSEAGPLTGMAKTWEYDNLGRVTRTTEATGGMGGERTYAYDDAGDMIEFVRVHPSGMGNIVETFSYDAAHQVIQSTDPRGYSTDYAYNWRGQVTRTDLPDPDGAGPVWRPYVVSEFDALGRMTLTSEDWRVTQYEYDSRDRLVETILPNPDVMSTLPGPSVTYAYDAAGRLASETDTLGHVTQYQYDDEGRVTQVTLPDPDGAGPQLSPTIQSTYNALGSVLTTTDPAGGVRSYEYDALQRNTKITDVDPDGAGPLSAPETVYTYGSNGLLASILDPLGRTTSYQYDAIGRQTGITDHLGNATTYTLNLDGQIATVTQPDPDGTGPLSAPVTSYTYDDFQRVLQITDAENGITSFTYDAAGNLLTLTDPVLNTTSYAYDGLGAVTMETNQLGDSRSFYYDTLGRLARKLDRNERLTAYASDEWDQVVSESWYENPLSTAPEISIVTTSNGGAASEVQRIGFSDDAGSLYGDFTITYDGQTTGLLSHDASAATVQSALEGLSNIQSGDVTVVKLIDTWEQQEWRIDFGGTLANTNLPQTTIDTSMLYTMGNLTEVEATDTHGGATGGNEVQEVTLSNATSGNFRLAFAGFTTAPIAHSASASQVESALEALNVINDVIVTKASSTWTIEYTGTLAGSDQPQLNGDASTTANGTLVETANYVFDLGGRLTSASDSASSYAYTYDALGRVLTVDNAGTAGVPNVVLTSAFDISGNRTSLSATIDGTADFLNAYTYDGLNRLTQLTQDDQTGGNTVADKRVDFSYNTGGQYTEIARFNDVARGAANEVATSTYTYDSLARLTGLDYEKGGVDLFTPYSWAYDDQGRITQAVSQDGTTDYEYDATGQLTAADHSNQANELYSYDANGNRTMTGYQTGANNQLLNDGTHSYTYDDEGNRTSKTNDTTQESVDYEWDFRNRLVKVTSKDGSGNTTQIVEYTYDVFNIRIGREVDTTSPFDMADAAIERYVLDDLNGVTSIDGGNVVLDFVDDDGVSGSGAIDLENRYLYSNAVDQVLAQENVGVSGDDEAFWLLSDHLGTVRVVVDNSSALETHFVYGAFGEIVSGDTTKTRYGYTGRESDNSTSLQFNRARYFSPEIGQWISEDPIGFQAQDPNLMRYVGNSPITNTDPSGLYRLVFVGNWTAKQREFVKKTFAEVRKRALDLKRQVNAQLSRGGLDPSLRDHLIRMRDFLDGIIKGINSNVPLKLHPTTPSGTAGYAWPSWGRFGRNKGNWIHWFDHHDIGLDMSIVNTKLPVTSALTGTVAHEISHLFGEQHADKTNDPINTNSMEGLFQGNEEGDYVKDVNDFLDANLNSKALENE